MMMWGSRHKWMAGHLAVNMANLLSCIMMGSAITRTRGSRRTAGILFATKVVEKHGSQDEPGAVPPTARELESDLTQTNKRAVGLLNHMNFVTQCVLLHDQSICIGNLDLEGTSPSKSRTVLDGTPKVRTDDSAADISTKHATH